MLFLSPLHKRWDRFGVGDGFYDLKMGRGSGAGGASGGSPHGTPFEVFAGNRGQLGFFAVTIWAQDLKII